jgi:predicted secreted acid phosphatase
VSGKTFGGFSAPSTIKDQFGKRFIVLPNPMYGNWASAIHSYNFKLSEEEKAAKRKNQLHAY